MQILQREMYLNYFLITICILIKFEVYISTKEFPWTTDNQIRFTYTVNNTARIQ